MPLLESISQRPELKSLIRKVEAGSYLFRQGVEASTMFLILRGTIELRSENRIKGSMVGLVQAGQMLGEKSMLQDQPYPRAFSAKAKNECLVLELSSADFNRIRRDAPDVMADILRQMFQTAVLRLDRANYLTAILRSSDNVERLVHLLLYFSKCHGTRTEHGVRFRVPMESIYNFIDLELPRIEDCLNELVVHDLLIRELDDTYVLPNEQALMEFVPKLSERFNSGFFDELESVPMSTLG